MKTNGEMPVYQGEGTNLEEDQDIDLISRDAITAETILAIEGIVHFDELVVRCDDAYVAADPENHKPDIQEARIVLERGLEIAPILTKGVIQVRGDMIFKRTSARTKINGELAYLVDRVANFEERDALLFDVLKLREKDLRRLVRAISSTMKLKNEIKDYLSECGPLNLDNTLGLKLKKIRDNYGYTIDQVLEALPVKTRETLSQESEEDFDLIHALIKAGTISYVDKGYFTRKREVGTLIVSQSLPEHFLDHFQNLRECYALGLFQATVIYCRAVIEAGCFEALRRRGQVRLDSKAEDIREYSLKRLMQSIKPYVYRDNWDKADKTIKKADSVLHSKRHKVVLTQPEAYDSIKDTVAIVEEIFSSGSHKNQRR